MLAAAAVRDLLGMDVAFSTRFEDGHQVFEVLDDDLGAPAAAPGRCCRHVAAAA